MVVSDTEKPAKKIAEILETDTRSSEYSSIFAAIEKINKRIDKLELPQSENRLPHSDHPSLDKLNIAEAIADSIFGSQAKEKACTFEPSKPCDHCSMCNTRGF